MDFTNESYVRLYTRKTMLWNSLGYEGQAVFMFVEMNMDRSGVFDLGGFSPVAAIVGTTTIPKVIAEAGLKSLLDKGVFVLGVDSIVDPLFVEAQTASKSNKQRQRDFRDRHRADRLPEASQTPFGFENNDSLSISNGSNARESTAQHSTGSVSEEIKKRGLTETAREAALPRSNRPPVGEPPGDLESQEVEPELWERIHNFHAREYGKRRPGMVPPRREKKAREVADWCQESARAYRCTPEVLAKRVVLGLFKNQKAGESRWALGFAANDPEEYAGKLPGAPSASALENSPARQPFPGLEAAE